MQNIDTEIISRVYLEQIQQPVQSTASTANPSAAQPAQPTASTANQASNRQSDPGNLLQQGLNPNTSVENYVNFLQKNQDKRVRAVLQAGLGDGNPQDEILTIANDQSIPVNKLKPTQNQIGIIDSLFNLFTDENNYNSLPKILQGTDIKLGKPGDDKILAYSNGKEFFVLDGHHRWSTVFVGKADATVVCDLIQGKLTAAQILKAVHSAIYADTGTTVTDSPQGENLLNPSEYTQDAHNQYVSTTLDNKYRAVWRQFGLDDDTKITNHTWNNILLMRNNGVAQGAPERKWMPQPGKSQSTKYQDLLKKGIVNFNQPKTADLAAQQQSPQPQTIAASYNYKGDSKLLWETYQDILISEFTKKI